MLGLASFPLNHLHLYTRRSDKTNYWTEPANTVDQKVRGIGALIYREIWDVDIGSLVDADVCRRCLAFLAFLARYLLFLSLSYSLTKSISLLPVKVGEWNLA